MSLLIDWYWHFTFKREMDKYLFSGFSKHYHRYHFYLISWNFFIFYFISFSENMFFRNIQLTSICNYLLTLTLTIYMCTKILVSSLAVFIFINQRMINFSMRHFQLSIWMNSIKVIFIESNSFIWEKKITLRNTNWYTGKVLFPLQ